MLRYYEQSKPQSLNLLNMYVLTTVTTKGYKQWVSICPGSDQYLAYILAFKSTPLVGWTIKV